MSPGHTRRGTGGHQRAPRPAGTQAVENMWTTTVQGGGPRRPSRGLVRRGEPGQGVEDVAEASTGATGGGDLAAVWREATEEIADEIVSAQQRAYLRETRLRAIVEDTALLSVPDAFTRDQIEMKLRPAITEALSRKLGRPIQVAVTLSQADRSAERPVSPGGAPGSGAPGSGGPGEVGWSVPMGHGQLPAGPRPQPGVPHGPTPGPWPAAPESAGYPPSRPAPAGPPGDYPGLPGRPGGNLPGGNLPG